MAGGAGAAAREGWLLKRKKGRLGGWQRRFFALGGGALAYGAEEGEVKGGWARGTIPLAGVEGGCAVEGGGQVLVLRARIGEGDAEPREFQLKAGSAEEARAWAEALQAALGELSLEGGGERRQPPPRGDGDGPAGGPGAPSAGREGDAGTPEARRGEAPAAASGLPGGMQPRQSVVGEVPAVREEEPPAPHDEVQEPSGPGGGPPEPDAPPSPQGGGSPPGDEPAGGASPAAAPAAEAEAASKPGKSGAEKDSGHWGTVKGNVDRAQKLGNAVGALTGTKPKPKRLYGADLVRHLEEQKKEEEARKGPRKKRVPKWKLEEGRWVINDQCRKSWAARSGPGCRRTRCAWWSTRSRRIGARLPAESAGRVSPRGRRRG